jgi:hypothetical protein
MEQNRDEQMNSFEDWGSRITSQFLAECFVAYEYGYTPIEDFFYLYDEWSRQQSMPTPSFIKIVSAMEIFGFRIYELKTFSIKDEGETGYHGITPIWSNIGDLGC